MTATTLPASDAHQVLGACPHDCPDTCSLLTTVQNGVAIKVQATRRTRAGGVLLSSSGAFPVQRAALQRPDLLAGRTPRSINMVTIGNALLRTSSPEFGPAVEALVVYNSNPVAIAPESAKVVQGFAREDLFTVVLEHFQTDTADYVLPATKP